jgi:hypothetical protein
MENQTSKLGFDPLVARNIKLSRHNVNILSQGPQKYTSGKFSQLKVRKRAFIKQRVPLLPEEFLEQEDFHQRVCSQQVPAAEWSAV